MEAEKWVPPIKTIIETSTKLALQNNYANRFYELHKHCICREI